MDTKPVVAIADVLDAQRLVWADTVYTPGWAVPTSGGGAVVQPGGTDVHLGTIDRLWLRKRSNGRETHIDLPPGALPARAGHAVAAVSVGGEMAALANLATGASHHVAERAPAFQSRLAKWPLIVAFVGLLAAVNIADPGHKRTVPGTDWPRVAFMVLVAAGPALLVLLAVRGAVARVRERDEAVDAALAAALAGLRPSDRGAKTGAPNAGRAAARSPTTAV